MTIAPYLYLRDVKHSDYSVSGEDIDRGLGDRYIPLIFYRG